MEGERRLTSWSYVVLALIGERGAAPHDLVDMMRRGGRLFYAAAPSQVYAEPKRLEAHGFVASRTEPGRTTERTFYTLTPKGLAALRSWLAEPSSYPRVQSEANVRLMAGDLVDDATILISLRALKAEIEELRSLTLENEQKLATVSHRARYLKLSFSLGHRLLDAHEAWLAEVEEELGGDETDARPRPATT